MAKKFIDLATAIENDIPSDPPNMIPKITYQDHKIGANMMKMFFPGATEKDLPGGLGWAVEEVTLSTHSGSHLDAPYHYHPTMNKGERAWTIDEIPLEWCYGPGVVVNFRDMPDGHRVSAAEMEAALKKIAHELSAGDIVLVMTGADRFWGKQEYLIRGWEWGRKRRYGLWSVECGWWEPMRGAGIALYLSSRKIFSKHTTPRSSGKDISPESRRAIVTSRN